MNNRVLDTYDITPEEAQLRIGRLEEVNAQLRLDIIRQGRVISSASMWLRKSDAEMRLAAGEMTAQEIRSVKAVLTAILSGYLYGT